MLYKDIQGSDLPVKVACGALGVSRTAYQHWWNKEPLLGKKSSEELVKEIRCIAREFPRYGYRRITHQLRRQGFTANHKKVLKTMKKEGLTCKKRRYSRCTTDSKHGLPVYQNLAKELALTAPNQLLVSDITYIELEKGHAYLAVVMDAFSKKCLGWQLSKSIDARLCTDALEMAVRERNGTNLAGTIHHSDQGVQYASNEYVALLESHGFKISMSRKGNPYDNAYAESFIKTLKYEAVYLTEYENFEEAHDDIQNFIEEVYNKKRLHSSIGYITPAECEKQWILNNKRS